MIDLAKEHIDILKNIIKKELPDCEILLFGSRVNGNAREFSDIDIALKSNMPIDKNAIWSIKENLEESNLPYLVDIVDLNSISDEFCKAILQNYQTL